MIEDIDGWDLSVPAKAYRGSAMASNHTVMLLDLAGARLCEPGVLPPCNRACDGRAEAPELKNEAVAAIYRAGRQGPTSVMGYRPQSSSSADANRSAWLFDQAVLLYRASCVLDSPQLLCAVLIRKKFENKNLERYQLYSKIVTILG